MKDWISAFPMSKSPISESRLTGQVLRRTELDGATVSRMYDLLCRYFEAVTPARFRADLDQKDWVILLTDAAGAVRGFSTLQRLELNVDGRPVIAFFSGDTIIDRQFWGEMELPRLFLRHVLGTLQTPPGVPAYWFLISSGYKTYRYLPAFFHEFYPAFDRPTPGWVKKVMDRLGEMLFPEEYDPGAGIVRFREATPLAAGVAEVTDHRRKNPHVDFFVSANPGHAAGDELVCLAELSAANLRRVGRRMVGPGPGGVQ